MKDLRFVAVVVGRDNYMYLFYNDDSAFCVDPTDAEVVLRLLGMEFDKQVYTREEIVGMKEGRGRRTLVYSFTTHRHLDHSGGNARLRELSPNTTQVSGFDGEVCECGDKFYLDKVEIECIFTPCHTQNSFCYYVGGEYLVTGDTLFFLGCGRFFEGTPMDMIQAIEKIKNRVNHQAVLLYGHDYNEQDTRFAEQFLHIPEEIRGKRFLMLHEEIRYNPFFNLGMVGMEGSGEDVMEKLRRKKDNFRVTG